MTDLEMTKLCAEAMGWKFFHSRHGHWELTDPDGRPHTIGFDSYRYDPHSGEKLPELDAGSAVVEAGYDPLHDDAQCFALIKHLALDIQHKEDGTVEAFNGLASASDTDLNSAVVECAAKIQKAKHD